jgi:hypothetical protein
MRNQCKKFKIKMTKKLFTETIQALQNQYDHDSKCNEAFKVILPDDFVIGYKNNFLSNQIVKLLQVAMNDEQAHSWIEYWLYELEFGKQYKKGCVTEKDGSVIDISSAGKLYEFLEKQNKFQNKQ